MTLKLTPSDNLELSRYKRDVRVEVDTWLARLRMVAERIAGGEGICLAINQEARKHGVPYGTFRRKWDAFRDHGWKGLINRAKTPADRGVGLPPKFIQYWKGRMEAHQRDTTGKQARRELIKRWDAWLKGDDSQAIPGYDLCPKPERLTGYPSGWSMPNLLRYGPSAYERTLRRQGTMAAKSMLPSVRTTRVGLQFFEMVMMDDQWHDTYVNFIGRGGNVINRRAMRPISFNAIDVLSGCDFTRGYKPIIWDAEEQKRKMFTDADFFWFFIHVLTDFGWRSDIGTTFVMEHGTASLQTAIRNSITSVTDGKVQFRLSGIHGAPLKGLYFEGQSRGNFKFKAARESWFNLFRNHMAALKAPTGLGPEKAPEESYGLLRYNNTLLKAMEKLGPQRAGLLRMPVLNWFDYVPLAEAITEEINRRDDHDLEGWEKCGFTAQDVRLSPASQEWMTMADVARLEDPRAQELALSLMTVPGHRRDRKLSPRDVFELGRENAPLTKLNPHLWNVVIPSDYAHETKVNHRHEILVIDPQLGEEPLCYTSLVTTQRGREEVIPAGTPLRVYVNPHRTGQALVCEMNDAAIGLAQLMDRPARNDEEGMAKQAGRVRHMEAILQRAPRQRANDLAEERTEMREHNRAVIDGEPITGDEKASASRMKKATKRANQVLDAASAEQGTKHQEPVLSSSPQPAPFIDPLDR